MALTGNKYDVFYLSWNAVEEMFPVEQDKRTDRQRFMVNRKLKKAD